MIDLYPKINEEWEARHDSIVLWEGMWLKLVLAFFFASAYLILFTDKLWLAIVFVVAQWIFAVFHYICGVRHRALHDEVEDQEE